MISATTLIKICQALTVFIIFGSVVLIFTTGIPTNKIAPFMLFVMYLIELARAEAYRHICESNYKPWCSTCGKDVEDIECKSCRTWWENQEKH